MRGFAAHPSALPTSHAGSAVSAGRLLLWFGLLGAPLAWTAQLIVGYGTDEAACSPAGARWHVGTGTFQAATFAATATVGVAAIGAALWMWRRAESGGDVRGRMLFMASGGVAVGVLFLLLILVTGSGVLSLDPCDR
jgi:hypothetical protein